MHNAHPKWWRANAPEHIFFLVRCVIDKQCVKVLTLTLKLLKIYKRSWCTFEGAGLLVFLHANKETFISAGIPKQQNYDFSCAQSFHHLVLTCRVEGGGACSIVTDTRVFTLGWGASDNGQGGWTAIHFTELSNQIIFTSIQVQWIWTEFDSHFQIPITQQAEK